MSKHKPIHRKDPKTGPPVSARIKDLIAPFMDESTGIEAVRNLVAIAATGWNLGLIRDRGAKDPPTPEGAEPVSAEAMALIEQFVASKKKLFPYDMRFITSYEVTALPSGEPNITVASTLFLMHAFNKS